MCSNLGLQDETKMGITIESGMERVDIGNKVPLILPKRRVRKKIIIADYNQRWKKSEI